VPSCTYCRPQIASIGLTQAKARENGREVAVGKFPFTASGKAVAAGRPEEVLTERLLIEVFRVRARIETDAGHGRPAARALTGR
jgi:ABC-type cobalamin/Fe3+-siderophores transport system ATPase subunit